MSAILSAFGIDWRLLIVNAVNFGLLLLILWYFLYGPLMRMLEKRRELVAQGVIDAQNAGKHLREVEETKAQTLAQAGKEADEILSKARAAGTEKGRELKAEGEAAAARLLADAKKEAIEERDRALLEAKGEIAKLIVLGLEKEVHKQS